MSPFKEFLNLTATSYNSAVFSSISANSYLTFSVSKSFIEDTQCRNCTNIPDFERGVSNFNQREYPKIFTTARNLPIEEFPSTLDALWNQARAGTLDRLEPAECIDQYAQIIQSNRRNVLLVADDSNFPPPEENYYINGSRAYWADAFWANSAGGASQAADSYSWICSGILNSDLCSIEVDNVKRVPESWRVGWYCKEDLKKCTFSSWPVEYCLSESAEPHCKLHFEPNIAIVITVLNLGECPPICSFRLEEASAKASGSFHGSDDDCVTELGTMKAFWYSTR